MKTPTIHLNGTSRKTLLEANKAARNSLRLAIEFLDDTAPNARDYYPQGDGAYVVAEREFLARKKKLVDVLAELVDIETAIEDAP